MALLCRIAARAAGKYSIRSATLASRCLLQKPTPPRRFPSLPIRRSLIPAEILGSAESLMPLHSAIASARLRSFLAVDSTYWSCLSQEFAVPR